MKTISKRTKLIAAALAFIVLAVVLIVSNERRVEAISDEEYTSSPFGLSAGQTARLSVLNTGRRAIMFHWGFLDSQGNVLARSRGPALLPAVQMTFVDLNADELNVMIDRFGRIQMRAVVWAKIDPSNPNLQASIEIFDNATGKTTAFVPAVQKVGFNPQPDPPGIQR